MKRVGECRGYASRKKEGNLADSSRYRDVVGKLAKMLICSFVPGGQRQARGSGKLSNSGLPEKRLMASSPLFDMLGV